jgi:hypothetical protein
VEVIRDNGHATIWDRVLLNESMLRRQFEQDNPEDRKAAEKLTDKLQAEYKKPKRIDAAAKEKEKKRDKEEKKRKSMRHKNTSE